MVDDLHSKEKKLCYWDSVKGNHVICDEKDMAGRCGSECSNASSELAKYALCDGSNVCGLDYVFIDDLEFEKLSVEFSNKDQVCVYKIVESHSMLDYVLHTIQVKVIELSNVHIQLYS